MKLNLSSLSSVKKVFAYGDQIRPARDWFILLTTVFILFLVSIAWNIFLFNQFQNVQSAVTVAAPQASQSIAPTITKVQTLFQQRATEETNYQQNYHFVDPSTAGS